MFTWEYPPRIIGGIARHCYGLARALNRRGIEVHIFTPEFPNTPYEESNENLFIHRVKIELGHPNFIIWVLLMNHFLEKRLGLEGINRFDVIHSHDWLTTIAGINVKHLGKKPFVLTIHSTESKRSSGLSTSDSILIDGIEWWGTYEARRIITVSNSMKKELIDHFKLPPNKVEVIPNGVNPDDFKVKVDKGKVKMSLGFSPFDRIVLFIGRLTEQKGAYFLIKAFPEIYKRHKEARLVIVGDGPQMGYLKGLVYDMGIGHLVRFLGHVDDSYLRTILASSDALVIPSIYEPFGIVALEGMAAGVPVVASHVNGLGEVVKHEVNGITVFPADPSSIAWGVNRVLEDEELVKRIIREGRKTVIERYSWDIVAEKTQKVYEDVVTS